MTVNIAATAELIHLYARQTVWIYRGTDDAFYAVSYNGVCHGFDKYSAALEQRVRLMIHNKQIPEKYICVVVERRMMIRSRAARRSIR